jgi:hypothetical protein
MTKGTQYNLVMLTVVTGVHGKMCYNTVTETRAHLVHAYFIRTLCTELVILVLLVETGVTVTKSITKLHYSMLVFPVNTGGKDHKKNYKFLL